MLPADVIVIKSPTSSDEGEPEVTGVARGDEEDEREKWSRWILLMTSVQASVDRARSNLNAELFSPRGSLRPLYFDMRHAETSTLGSAAGRLAHMKMGLAFGPRSS